MPHVRYNPNKADTTEFGHSKLHDVEDTLEAVDSCCSDVCLPAINIFLMIIIKVIMVVVFSKAVYAAIPESF